MEQWKKIPGFEAYEASTLGNIRNARGHILKPWLDGGGNYYQIQLGGGKSYSVHRLIALTYIPNPEDKPTVNHIDENKTNNCVENLEWATRSEQEIKKSSNERYERNITFHKGLYMVQIWRRPNKFYATRATLEEAIQCRDDFLAML